MMSDSTEIGECYRAQLFVLGGVMKGKIFRIRDSLLLGRSAICDVRLDDPKVSRRNTRIFVDPKGQLILSDLGSKNGTQLDRERVAEVVVQSGSIVSVGDTDFLVQLSAEGPDSTSPKSFRLNLPGGPVDDKTMDG